MRRAFRMGPGLVLCLVAVASHSSPAHAYLDPGTGSILLQALLGGVAGALVVGKLYWSKLKLYYTGLRNRLQPHRKGPDESETAPPPP